MTALESHRIVASHHWQTHLSPFSDPRLVLDDFQRVPAFMSLKSTAFPWFLNRITSRTALVPLLEDLRFGRRWRSLGPASQGSPTSRDLNQGNEDIINRVWALVREDSKRMKMLVMSLFSSERWRRDTRVLSVLKTLALMAAPALAHCTEFKSTPAC